jgi:hypothetical protein
MESPLEEAKLVPTRIEQEVDTPTERSVRLQEELQTVAFPDSVPEDQRPVLEADREERLGRIEKRISEGNDLTPADYRFVKARYLLFVDHVQRAATASET